MSYPLTQSHDGAKAQAQAVLAMVRSHYGDGLSQSWNEEFHRHDAEPIVSRWENGREQGYVIRMKDKNYTKQINIGFWEGRSGDHIEVLVFETSPTMNAPTLHDVPKGDFMRAGDVTKAFGFGKIDEAARFIKDALSTFWDANVDNKSWRQKRLEEQA